MTKFRRRERSESERLLLSEMARLLPAGIRTPTVSGEHAMIVDSGRGCWLRDISGNEYLDYMMGSGPLLLGHAHPAVVDAVRQQASRGSSYLLLGEYAVELAQEIVNCVPCAEKVVFNSTGSESTFFALRLARAFTGRSKILKFEGAFHGMNDYALMSNQWTQQPAPFPSSVPNSAGIPGSLSAEVLVAPWNDPKSVEQIIEAHAGELAAVILEPLQRTLPPEPGFLEHVRALSLKHGIVLIFDEVVTGFRLALGGAQEYYGVTPDLATICKGIASGYPISILCGRSDIMDLADPARLATGDPVHLSGTFSGNAISCVAALATLRELRRPGVYESLFVRGGRLMRGLSKTMQAAGVPCHVRGEPPAFQPWFGEHVVQDFRGMLASDSAKSLRFSELLLDRGIIKAHEKFFVSTAHGDSEIDLTLEALAEVARLMAAAG